LYRRWKKIKKRWEKFRFSVEKSIEFKRCLRRIIRSVAVLLTSVSILLCAGDERRTRGGWEDSLKDPWDHTLFFPETGEIELQTKNDIVENEADTTEKETESNALDPDETHALTQETEPEDTDDPYQPRIVAKNAQISPGGKEILYALVAENLPTEGVRGLLFILYTSEEGKISAVTPGEACAGFHFSHIIEIEGDTAAVLLDSTERKKIDDTACICYVAVRFEGAVPSKLTVVLHEYV